jgi:cystathionine gamma-synthase
VESLVEWRFHSDSTVSPTLCRFSIGIEDSEELKNDLLAALRKWHASPDITHEQG